MPSTMSHRPPFDPRHEFVVTPSGGRPSASIAGREFLAGQVLDKGLVSARRLRQMYDVRLIAVAPGSKLLPRPPAKPGAMGPEDNMLAAAEAVAGGDEEPQAKPPKVPRRQPQRAAEAA